MKISKFKRILALIIAGAAVCTFAACNTDGAPSPVNPPVADGEGKEDGSSPLIPTVPKGSVKITAASGDLEEAYVVWDKVEGATGYNVYVKNEGENGDYEKLDAPLVREYADYFRADAVGLKAGTYGFKVVPTGGADDVEDGDKAATATNISVLPHDRSGYAFVNGTSSGAYNEDGTLKENANVIYVTDENKDTVELDGVTGVQNILQAQRKATAPLSIRLVGNVTAPAVPDKSFNSYDKSLQIKENSQGITLEGIGSDATANGWTVRLISTVNVEVRNIGVMNTQCSEPDGISIEKGNHIWVHNCDIFYGGAGGDSDQAKGDGALDTKIASYVTHSYNHFWDCGKCNLQGMKSESVDNFITYHHNWYDHSDSRHPRIRTCTVHVYNNYFDGNAKYGVGVTTGASVFVENNYFRSTVKMKPMLVSAQGTDALGEGTFSGESGGVIKAYGNEFDGPYSLITQNDTADKSGIDCYLAATRDEIVPAEYIAATGSKYTEGAGNSYNNFDTAADFYEYEVDSAEVAKEKVEKYAGRVDGGDFKWEFDNSTEDANYSIIAELKTALMNYTTDLVSVGGIEIGTPGGSTDGDGEETGGPTGGTEGGAIEGAITFIPSASGNGFTVTGTTKDTAAITIEGVEVPKGAALKLNSSGKVTFTTTEEMTLNLYIYDSTTVNVDGTNRTPSAANGYYVISLNIAAGEHTVSKGGGETYLYLIKLIPLT